jgi:hypothetical protein
MESAYHVSGWFFIANRLRLATTTILGVTFRHLVIGAASTG